jgi:hypothetical protein
MGRVILEGVKFVPNWTSIIGAVAGVLRARGDNRPTEYLMGMTGFAFRLHIRDTVCASSATTGYRWTDDVLDGLKRLGYRGEAYFVTRENPAFDNVRSEVCRRVVRSIDDGEPVVVWETSIPEFGLVYGHDSSTEVFYISGVRGAEREEQIRFGEVGNMDVGILYALFIMDRLKVDSTEKELEALRWAVDYFANPPINEADELHGVQGFAAYEKWAAELEENRASARGNAYMAQVSASARETVPPFLRMVAEGRDNISGPLKKAAKVYENIAAELRGVAEIFPYPGDETTLADASRRNKAAARLRSAAQAENEAVGIIAKAVN